MPDTRFLRRLTEPPPTQDRGLDRWLRDLTRELNLLPNFLTSETTNGPNSRISAPVGTVFIEGSSSHTTLIWIKTSGNSNIGWKSFDLT